MARMAWMEKVEGVASRVHSALTDRTVTQEIKDQLDHQVKLER